MEPDDKRQSQNRLSQRAHRARKTDYIATLEERLRQYEADEIHSNVRLQEVARALKADNERLKKETIALKGRLLEIEGEKDAWASERRMMDGIIAALRQEVDMLRTGHFSPPQHLPSIVIEPPRPTFSQPVRRNSGPKRAVAACPICPDPDPDCPCQNPGSSSSPPSLTQNHIHTHGLANGHIQRCGFCQSSSECLCVDEPEDVKPIIDPDCGVCKALGGCICDAPQQQVTTQTQPVMLNSLGESAMLSAGVDSNGAMRLRLKTRSGPKTTLWAIEPVSKKEAVCSGDPSNCEACRDDSFGREFCSHLFSSSSSSSTFKPCSTCPGNCMSIESLLCATQSNGTAPPISTTIPSPPQPAKPPRIATRPPMMDDDDDEPPMPSQLLCCGDPSLCGSAGCAAMPMPPPTPPRSSSSPSHPSPPAPASAPVEAVADAADHETMRPEQAWKALKAHPNARAANLALLADVVSGRTKCLGPRVEFSPVPEEAGAGGQDRKPQSVACRLEVETSAVRDALKMLDRTPTPASTPARALDDVDEEADARTAKRARLA